MVVVSNLTGEVIFSDEMCTPVLVQDVLDRLGDPGTDPWNRPKLLLKGQDQVHEILLEVAVTDVNLQIVRP